MHFIVKFIYKERKNNWTPSTSAQHFCHFILITATRKKRECRLVWFGSKWHAHCMHQQNAKAVTLSRLFINSTGHVMHAFFKCVSRKCSLSRFFGSSASPKNVFHVDCCSCCLWSIHARFSCWSKSEHEILLRKYAIGICVIHSVCKAPQFAYLLCLSAPFRPIQSLYWVSGAPSRARRIFFRRLFTSSTNKHI